MKDYYAMIMDQCEFSENKKEQILRFRDQGKIESVGVLQHA